MARLPDCRAYELATLADKAGLSPDAANLSLTQGPNSLTGAYMAYVFAAPDGDALYMTSRGAFAGARGPHHSNIVTVRTATGWQGASSSPPACTHDASGIFSGVNIVALSDDFSLAAYRYDLSGGGVSADCDPDDHGGVDIYTVARDGARDWGPPVWASRNAEPKTTDDAAAFAGISADGTHVLFTTPEQLLPVDAGREEGSGLYDRTGGRTVAVDRTSDGTLINACGASFPVGVGKPDSTAPWPISADARVIMFYAGSSITATDPGCSPTTGTGDQLFARIDGTRTVQLSRSQLAVPDPQARPAFIGATPDGRHVFFRSTERLIDGAVTGGGTYATGGALYEYDLGAVLDGGAATGTLRFLSPSLDGNPAGVKRLIDVTDDASVVTFTATGVLAAGAPASGTKIYQVRDGGAPTLVAAPHQADDLPAVSVSPDGSYVAYLDVDPAPGSVQQVYVVDARHPGAPTCISCPPAGATPTGPAAFVNSEGGIWPRVFGKHPFVTDDARVFFASPDRLARGDADAAWDVYEYRDGIRALLTPGTGADDALLLGTGPDGRDVFFATAASLLAEDFDNGDVDVYDARTGGGFAQPAAPPAPCAGDACRGPLAVTPVLSPVASAQVGPSGNVASVARAGTPTVHAARAGALGRAAVRIRVRVSGAGRIVVAGRAVRRVRRTVTRSGVYRVRVRLTPRARRALARRARQAHRLRRRGDGARGQARRALLTTTVRVTYRSANGQTAARRLRLVFGHSQAKHVRAGSQRRALTASRRAHGAAHAARKAGR